MAGNNDTPAPVPTYDRTRPPAEVRAAAAIDGDLTAMHAVANWFRDRVPTARPPRHVQWRATRIARATWRRDGRGVLQNLRAQPAAVIVSHPLATCRLRSRRAEVPKRRAVIERVRLLVNADARGTIVVRAVNGIYTAPPIDRGNRAFGGRGPPTARLPTEGR